MASQIFGGRVNREIEPERQDEGRAGQSGPDQAQPAAEAAQILERALAQVESMLDRVERGERRPAPAEERQRTVPQELTDLKRALREVVRRLEDALNHLGMEAQRLSDEASRLELVADRLQGRRTEPTGWLRGGRPASERMRPPPSEPEPEPEPEPLVPEEPRFRPGDQAVGIDIAAVPGFQGLMDVQRSLSSLPSVEGASVRSYRNGEAALEVVLLGPVSAREIVEGLRSSTGQQFLIEEARPEAQRLRLRFVSQEGPGLGVSSEPNG